MNYQPGAQATDFDGTRRSRSGLEGKKIAASKSE